MHSPNPEFDLPMLRRQLEEILAIVKTDDGDSFVRTTIDQPALSAGEHNAIIPEPDQPLTTKDSETGCEPAPLGEGQATTEDDLYDDALVVVTEFGQASPSMLQMWLSIDYGRALTILNRFQADGLVSSKGRVRHKAYSLRRSEAPQEGRDGRIRD